MKQKLTYALTLSLCILIYWRTTANTITPIAIGKEAPNIELPDENGNIVNLKNFRGKKVILFFYPKDGTPGCTKEVCSLRDNYKIFAKNNIVLIGVNYDSPATHRTFKEKNNLPFILLSDTKGEAAKRFGAYAHWWHYFAPQRITFIIDEHGLVAHILSDIDVINHVQQITALLNIK